MEYDLLIALKQEIWIWYFFEDETSLFPFPPLDYFRHSKELMDFRQKVPALEPGVPYETFLHQEEVCIQLAVLILIFEGFSTFGDSLTFLDSLTFEDL